jgi:hypothetical protein
MGQCSGFQDLIIPLERERAPAHVCFSSFAPVTPNPIIVFHKQFNQNKFKYIYASLNIRAEVLCYKPEGCRFEWS